MATYYFRNVGTNWGDAANWSLTDGGGATGAVPTAADDAYFTSNSGDCEVNASNRTAKTLDFTGYTNTITMTFGITVSGNVTLDAGMTIAGTGVLTVNTTSTLTSNGKTWSSDFTFSGASQTYTLADDWTISGVLRLSGSTLQTINGNKIFTSGNLTHTGTNVQGTTIFEITGGTWSATGGGRISNDIIFNGNSTVSGTVGGGGSNLTYTSGTITTTGSTLNLSISTTLNTSGMSWDNITFAGGTTTLTSDCTATGNLTISATCTINGLFNLNVGGSLTMSSTTNPGDATIILNGTGTWSGGGAVRNNLTIDSPSGTITISGSVYHYTKVLKYVSGTVNTSGSTLLLGFGGIAGGIIDSNTLVWNNVQFRGASITLQSNIIIGGTLIVSAGTTCGVSGAFDVIALGSITISDQLSVPSLKIYTATTGTLSSVGSGIGGNVEINPTGTLTISGTMSCSGTWTRTTTNGGIVDTSKSTIRFGNGTVLNTNGDTNPSASSSSSTGINWYNIDFYHSGTNTISSPLCVRNTLTFNSSVTNAITGGSTIYVNGNLTVSNGAATIISGATSIVLNGTGVYSHTTTATLRYNLTINTNGTITISGNVYYNIGTFTYLSGTVITKNSTFNISTGTFINCDKINFATISVTAGATLTMNKFFSGSAIQPTRIRSTGANYTIAFQDGFEKITKFTRISNCTVSRRGQLLCITDKSNKGGNVGVRYINQLPNGVPKNAPTVAAAMAYSVANISDPNFIIG